MSKIKDWFTMKAIALQTKQANSLTDAIDQVLVQKAERLRKEGKKVNKENLIAGYKALIILGASKGLVEDRIQQYLK